MKHTRFNPSKKLNEQAKLVYLQLLPLVHEYKRLTNLMVNAKRDVDMWGRRVEDLTRASEIATPPKDLTRPIEVATEQFELAKKTWVELAEPGSPELVTNKRLVEAKALLAHIEKVMEGPYDWVAIDASREQKIGDLNKKFDVLAAEGRDHYKIGMKIRRAAVKKLEEHDGEQAVKLIKQAQANLAEAAEYPEILQTLQEIRSRYIAQGEIASIAEWLRVYPEVLEKLINPLPLAGSVI